MAKFLNTSKSTSELEDIICKANASLILISPYLKLSDMLKERLQFRNSQQKLTIVVYGKKELGDGVMDYFNKLDYVELRYKENLHAKCYANDEKIVVTSLNMYDFSMINNLEMGVLIERNNPNDSELFKDATSEISFILTNSEEKKKAKPIEQLVTKPSAAQAKSAEKLKPATGYCIRTGVKIPFNIERPLCLEAFREWNKYANGDYPEKFCHFSGEPSNGETCFAKPVLQKNYRKAQKIHGFK